MTRLSKIMMMIGAALLAVWLTWTVVQRSWLAPRQDLLSQIDELEQGVAERQRALETRPRINRSLREVTEQTLGGDVQTVDHQMRSRLNRIVEEIGLASFSVSTGSAVARQSPAARSLFSRAGAQRAYREEIDFVELDGAVQGRGSLEQVLALVDRIDAVPWLNRIESLALKPRGNGEQFDVTVRLRTMFLPGATVEDPPQERYDSRRRARYASLVTGNPFRIPPPPPPEPDPEPEIVEQPQPKPDPPFPYGSWKLTGVVEGPEGAEIWLINRSNGESRRMLVGGRIGNATLVGADGEFATFQLEEAMFSVQVGGTLDNREPAGYNREV